MLIRSLAGRFSAVTSGSLQRADSDKPRWRRCQLLSRMLLPRGVRDVNISVWCHAAILLKKLRRPINAPAVFRYVIAIVRHSEPLLHVTPEHEVR